MAQVSEAAETQSPLSNLLTQVAKAHLSDAAAAVVCTLISHGRLTARDICDKAQLSMKLVKTTLVSLIQLGCVLYWQSGNRVEYVFTKTGLFTFLHSGEILTHLKSVYDEDTSEIVQNVLVMGHLRISDFLQNFDLDTAYTKNSILLQLYRDGWLKIVQPHDFHPLQDVWNQIFDDTTKLVPRSASLSEVKRVAEITLMARLKLSALLESLPPDLYMSDGGTKVLNPQLCIGFNYGRFEKYLRSKALVSLCQARIGLLSAQVYQAVLEAIEKNSPETRHYLTQLDGVVMDPEDIDRVYNDMELEAIEKKAIVVKLGDIEKRCRNLNLDNSILGFNFAKPLKRHREGGGPAPKRQKIKQEFGINQHDNIDIDHDIDHDIDDNVSDLHDINSNHLDKRTLIIHHLKLLAFSSDIPFIIELGNGTFTVPYYKLKESVRQYNFEELVKKTLGSESLRILRCIRSLQLVDEKTIANSVLTKDKVVRNEIYKLIELNIIEIQEIPRSQDRAASKTFFTFRYKKNVNFKFLKNSLLYGMALILHNIDSFKLQHKVLLDKCQREDVKGHEQELLLDSELKTLNGIQQREIHNMGKFNRLLALYDVFK